MITHYFYVSVLLVFALSVGQNAEAKSKRDDSLKVACITADKLSGGEADEQWCQCENDYYAELLTDEDWEKTMKPNNSLRRLIAYNQILNQ